jgi:hypothetical protein
MNIHDSFSQITLWLPYMAHEQVLSILDQALFDFNAMENGEGTLDVLRGVLSTIERNVNATADDVPGLRSRLPQLLSLYSVKQDWTLLEHLIAGALDSVFTAWIDGVPAGASISPTLEPLVLTSCSRWSKRSGCGSAGLDVSVFLKRPEWTSHTASILKNSIYASKNSRKATQTFLESRASLDQPALNLASIIWWWLDASDISNITSSGTWRNHFDKLTASIVDIQVPMNHRSTCRRAILAMVQKLQSLRHELFSGLLACVKGLPHDTLTPEMLRLGKNLIDVLPQECDTFAYSLIDHALSWISHSFAGPDYLDAGIVKALGAPLLVPNIFSFSLLEQRVSRSVSQISSHTSPTPSLQG